MGATDRLHGYGDRKTKKNIDYFGLNIGIQWGHLFYYSPKTDCFNRNTSKPWGCKS